MKSQLKSLNQNIIKVSTVTEGFHADESERENVLSEYFHIGMDASDVLSTVALFYR